MVNHFFLARKNNPATGNGTALFDLQTTKSIESLVFDKQSNIILGIRVLTDEKDFIHNELITIDLSANSTTAHSLADDSYYQLVLSDEGELYGIRDVAGYTNPETTVLVEMDPSNGEETMILDLETTSETESLVFDNQIKRILGVES